MVKRNNKSSPVSVINFFKKDVYPKSIHEPYELLENHSSANKETSNEGIQPRGGRRDDEGIPTEEVTDEDTQAW